MGARGSVRCHPGSPDRPARQPRGGELLIAIDPNHAAIHSDLGNALHACGEPDEALRAFSTATRLAPDVAHLHFNLGNALNVKGRPEAALPAYGKAIEIEPGNPVFHNNLGNTLQELQRLDDAAQALERAVALDPRYSGCLLQPGPGAGGAG